MVDYEQSGKSIVYLDESGFALDAPQGYSPQGKRCYGRCDWHARGRVNAIGACLNQQLINVVLFDGNINSEVFYQWLVKELLMALPENVVIVLDNAAFHKRQDIREAIKNAGHILEYLPPYSPDLNPIEHKWAQAKAIRRKHRCSVFELFKHYQL